MRNRKNQFIVFSLEFLTLSSNQHFSSLFYYSGFALFMGLDKHTGRQIRQIRQAHRQTDQTDIEVDKLDVSNRQTHRYTDQKYQTDAQVYRLDTFDIPSRQTDKHENQTDQTTTEVDRLDILEKYTSQTTIQIKLIHRQTAKQIGEIQSTDRGTYSYLFQEPQVLLTKTSPCIHHVVGSPYHGGHTGGQSGKRKFNLARQKSLKF